MILDYLNLIKLTKLGNVYETEDGRHRILYLLNSGKSISIPAKVSRRFEDEEVNIILKELTNYYNVKVYKNNVLNDELNILICLNDKLYEIRNKNELVNFYNSVKSNNIINISSTDFKIVPKNNIEKNREIIKLYKKLIMQKYYELGETILLSNFSTLIKYFDNVNNSLFYDAFVSVLTDYQKSLMFDYEFNSQYEIENKVKK